MRHPCQPPPLANLLRHTAHRRKEYRKLTFTPGRHPRAASSPPPPASRAAPTPCGGKKPPAQPPLAHTPQPKPGTPGTNTQTCGGSPRKISAALRSLSPSLTSSQNRPPSTRRPSSVQITIAMPRIIPHPAPCHHPILATQQPPHGAFSLRSHQLLPPSPKNARWRHSDAFPIPRRPALAIHPPPRNAATTKPEQPRTFYFSPHFFYFSAIFFYFSPYLSTYLSI